MDLADSLLRDSFDASQDARTNIDMVQTPSRQSHEISQFLQICMQFVCFLTHTVCLERLGVRCLLVEVWTKPSGRNCLKSVAWPEQNRRLMWNEGFLTFWLQPALAGHDRIICKQWVWNREISKPKPKTSCWVRPFGKFPVVYWYLVQSFPSLEPITRSNVFVMGFSSSYNGLVCKPIIWNMFFAPPYLFHYWNLGFRQPKGFTYWSKIKGSKEFALTWKAHFFKYYVICFCKSHMRRWRGMFTYIGPHP